MAISYCILVFLTQFASWAAYTPEDRAAETLSALAGKAEKYGPPPGASEERRSFRPQNFLVLPPVFQADSNILGSVPVMKKWWLLR